MENKNLENEFKEFKIKIEDEFATLDDLDNEINFLQRRLDNLRDNLVFKILKKLNKHLEEHKKVSNRG